MEREVLLGKMLESHKKIVALLAAREDWELARPARDDGWSSKDIVAHIVAWYEVAAERLRLIAAGRRGEIQWIDERDADRLNEQWHRRHSGLTVADLREWYERAFAAVYALASAIDAETWSASDVVPVDRWLSAATFSHEQQHWADLAQCGD